MSSRPVSVQVPAGDGSVQTKTQTLWSTRWGPVVVLRAGLAWTDKVAYAIKDANLGNVRATEASLGFARARSVQDVRDALKSIGTPWVNTIAVDRQGNALYADVSVVPDVDAAQLQRCAPSKPAAALLGGPTRRARRIAHGVRLAARPGLAGAGADPDRAHAGRGAQRLGAEQQRQLRHPPAAEVSATISPLVGDASSPGRARAPAARDPRDARPRQRRPGIAAAAALRRPQLHGPRDRPDLLAACAAGTPPTAEARRLCRAQGWDRTDGSGRAGAHLFREFWRTARHPNVYRLPFDPAQPVATPAGLKMDDRRSPPGLGIAHARRDRGEEGRLRPRRAARQRAAVR